MAHRMELVRSDLGHVYSKCLCGWEAPYFWDTDEEAVSDYNEHYREELAKRNEDTATCVCGHSLGSHADGYCYGCEGNEEEDEVTSEHDFEEYKEGR